MAKKVLHIESVQQLHREGKWDEAKEGYLALLKKHPEDAEIWHALGIIHTQQRHFQAAQEYLKKAIELQPHEPAIQLHLANVYKLQGLFDHAIPLLEKTISANPEYAPAFNNLGTVFYAQGSLDNAIQVYNKAIEKFPKYIDAYYNLGLALVKKNCLKDAVQVYQTILVHVPDHFAARFHLACTWMLQNNFQEALKEFLTIESAQPFHFETQTNLANCYLKQGALNEAKLHYLKALELHLDDVQILFNLGVINMQQGNIDYAIQYYQRALQINPNYFAAHNNVGVAFLAKQHPEYALKHFKEALRIQPHNTAVSYIVNMLAQNKKLVTAPPDYIQSLFDAYADHYESHLLKALDYQIPSVFHAAVAKYLPHSASLDILDLGCGTGLCGIPFKAYAKKLTGVDLSTNMLHVAHEKKIYHELIKGDLTKVLSDQCRQYDLVIAGDVLVYIGDLDPLFKAVNQALNNQGLFLFNTEISQHLQFSMNQSGRFAHHKNYLDTLAHNNHFKILSYQTCVTRMQNNETVQGHLYVLRKA